MENLILYDAVSISSTQSNPRFWVEMLGLESLNWQDGRSRYYDKRLYSSTISIHYNDITPGGGTWLEMMGQGCRTFEDFGTGDFESLFNLVRHDSDNFKITRLDIAMDDHTGLLDMEQLSEDTRKQLYISKFTDWDINEGNKGRSVNHGSQKSDLFLRIYDKAMERGGLNEHWIRSEFQLRDERAKMWIDLDLPIGQKYAGVLLNYLRYIEPTADSNRRRWPMKQYWADLIGEAQRISLYVKPGVEYNLAKLNDFVFKQAGNAVATAMSIYGPKTFDAKLKERNTMSNPKYEKLVDQYRQTFKAKAIPQDAIQSELPAPALPG